MTESKIDKQKSDDPVVDLFPEDENEDRSSKYLFHYGWGALTLYCTSLKRLTVPKSCFFKRKLFEVLKEFELSKTYQLSTDLALPNAKILFIEFIFQIYSFFYSNDGTCPCLELWLFYTSYTVQKKSSCDWNCDNFITFESNIHYLCVPIELWQSLSVSSYIFTCNIFKSHNSFLGGWG